MADHIPFVLGNNFNNAQQIYNDSAVFRTELRNLQHAHTPSAARLWVDPAIDGLHSLKDRTDPWKSYMAQFPHFEKIASEAFQRKPDKSVVSDFVYSVLDACAKHGPVWVSAPQLPLVSDASRNKINRALADAAGRWMSEKKFSGKLILPVIFTNQNQLNQKTVRNQMISRITNCYGRAGAKGVWAVDSTIVDLAGSPRYQEVRFPGILSFHEELRDQIDGEAIIVAGPYWALNLILWARGLVDHPAIGVGRGYRYFISGGQGRPAVARATVTPLRRTVVVNNELAEWLSDSLNLLSPKDKAYTALSSLQKALPDFHEGSVANLNTAKFYKHWFDQIAANPPESRSLALYQDFSSAYVLGRTLPELPKIEKTARRPERPAEQFMLLCL